MIKNMVNKKKIHVISWRWKTQQKKRGGTEKGNGKLTWNNYDNPNVIYAQYLGVWYIEIDTEITLELEVDME